jgi:uncharacterized protein
MRNINMDVLRGIAVLGLMFMNAYFFGVFEYGYVPSTQPPLSDKIIHTADLIFVDGRFRTLFCLLFGAGLVIQRQHPQLRDKQFNRLKILAFIGLAHGLLLWAGDILLIYACAGWLTLKFIDQPYNQQLKQGIGFLALGAVISFLLAFIEPDMSPLTRESDTFVEAYQDWHSSFFSGFMSNILMFVVMLIALPLITLWMAAGIMLIGVALYKQGIFVNGLTTKQLNFILPAAVGFTLLRLIVEPSTSVLTYALAEPFNWFAALSTALLYIHLIVKLVGNNKNKFTVLQNAGRMSLTLYLMQTVIFLLCFRVVFPSWVLTFNRIDYWLLSVFIAVLQLSFCALYLRLFKHGPCEYVWRKLSS